MSTLERIIHHLPAYFETDPLSESGFTVLYDGVSGTAEIEHRTLYLRVTGGAGVSRTISLANRTIAEVATEIAGYTGYAVIVRDGMGTLSADALFEVHGDLIGGATLRVFTSLTWRVLAPLAWAIDATRLNMSAGGDQMAIPTAGGKWLELWGEYYGGLQRKGGEVDGDYAARIMREIRRIRLTRLALTQIIKEELGVTVEIRNLHELSWIVAETNFGILADRRHSRTTFEVRVDRTAVALSAWFDEQLRYLIDRHRAAGTLAFYASQNRGGNAGEAGTTVDYIAAAQIQSVGLLSSSLVWIVGEGNLGEQWLSIPANVASIVEITTRPPDEEGDPLVLGSGLLGIDQLGA